MGTKALYPAIIDPKIDLLLCPVHSVQCALQVDTKIDLMTVPCVVQYWLQYSAIKDPEFDPWSGQTRQLYALYLIAALMSCCCVIVVVVVEKVHLG